MSVYSPVPETFYAKGSENRGYWKICEVNNYCQAEPARTRWIKSSNTSLLNSWKNSKKENSILYANAVVDATKKEKK